MDEEWTVLSLPGAKCCVFRVSIAIIWLKSTMMKSMIKSGTEKGLTEFYVDYAKYLTDNGFQFKEKKRPAKAAGKKGFMVEKSERLKPRKSLQSEEQKVEVARPAAKDLKETAMYIISDFWKLAREKPT